MHTVSSVPPNYGTAFAFFVEPMLGASAINQRENASSDIVQERLSEWVVHRIEEAAPIAAAALLVANGLGVLRVAGGNAVVLMLSMLWKAAVLLLEAKIVGHPAVRPHARSVALLAAALVFSSVTFDAWYLGEPTTAALLLAAFVLVTPALVPWGWRYQLCFATMVLVSVFATLSLTVGVAEGLTTTWGAAVVLAAIVSLPISMQMEAVHRNSLQQAIDQERVQALYRELVEHAVEAIFRTDINGRILFANSAAVRLFGLEEQDLEGRCFFDFVDLAARQEVVQSYAEQYRGNQDRAFREVPIVDALGNSKWISQTVRVLRSRERIEGFHIVARDITDRVRIVEQLRQSEARFRSTFERAPIGIALVATDGRFLRVNDTLCRMLGYSSEELRERDFQSITFPPDLAADLALVQECLEGQRDSYEMEKRYVRKDGTLVTARLLVGLVRDSHGLPVHFVSLIEDVTERRLLERELARAKEAAESASRAKTMFLARMSHEIRTPLTGVLGMLDLLEKTLLTAEQQEYVDTAKSSGETLLALLNDLLDLSRIEFGQLDFRLEIVDGPALVHKVCRAFRTQAESKGLAFELRIAPDVPRWVRIDPKVLRQVVVNLVGNAIKFTAQGVVRVELSWEGSNDVRRGALHVAVTDTGPGIRPEEMAGLFEPFVQASTGCRAGGSGLGLAIVRRFAEALGGRTWVESELGKGSVFHAVLPAEEASSAQPEPSERESTVSAHPAKSPASPLRILVAEDHPVNQLLLKRLLEKAGYEVRVVPDGKAALALLEQERFDALLVDMQMPHMDGVALTRIVRERESQGQCFSLSGGPVAVIILTAHAWAEDRQRCLEAGANAYLAKPVQTATLQSTLRRCVAAEQRASVQLPRAAGGA